MLGGSLVVQLVLYCSYNYNIKILLFDHISAAENNKTNIQRAKKLKRKRYKTNEKQVFPNIHLACYCYLAFEHHACITVPLSLADSSR